MNSVSLLDRDHPSPLPSEAAGSWALGTYAIGSADAQAFRVGLGPHHQLSCLSSLQRTGLGLHSLHCHVSQSLIINLFLYTSVYKLLVLFLWRTLTNTEAKEQSR